MWPIIQGIILVLGSLLFLVIADRYNRRTLPNHRRNDHGPVLLFPPAILNSVMSDANPTTVVVFLEHLRCPLLLHMGPTDLGDCWRDVPVLAIRGRASGLASSFNWFGSFVVALLFPIMTASMQQEHVFAIFGVICLLGVTFIRLRVPETNGRSLEEIQANAIPERKKGLPSETADAASNL